jgi:hypothetical protein
MSLLPEFLRISSEQCKIATIKRPRPNKDGAWEHLYSICCYIHHDHHAMDIRCARQLNMRYGYKDISCSLPKILRLPIRKLAFSFCRTSGESEALLMKRSGVSGLPLVSPPF